ncbi:MAG TPA: hypothetical protein VIF12_05160 [Micavibrio sp.]
MDKKTLWKRASILGIVFAIAAGIDTTGYALFDREDGSNPLCRIDPYCRPLTGGEIALAKNIFGDAIDYKRAKVFNRMSVQVPRQSDGVMRMWLGNIYAFDEGFKTPDYSAAKNPAHRESFIHEMTHLWQFESNKRKLAKGLVISLLQHDFVYGQLYSYGIDDHKRFSDFNFEQQAQIIGHYQYYQDDFHDKTKGKVLDSPGNFSRSFNRKIRDGCKKLDKFSQLISQALPQTLEPGCAMYRPYDPPPADPFADKPASWEPSI